MPRVTESQIKGTYTEGWRYSNGTGGTNLRDSGTSRYFKETRPDRDLSRKPTGWLYPKPYSLDVYKCEPIQGRTRWRSTSYNSHHWMEGSLPIVHYSSLAANPSNATLQNQAEVAALLKLKEKSGHGFNAGVALAESQQTADFAGDIFHLLAKSGAKAVRKDFKGALRDLTPAWRSIPQTWLGWQYAAKPLMSDVTESLKALERRREVSDWVITVKSRKTSKSFFQDGLRSSGYNATWRKEWREDSCFVRLDYHPGNELVIHLNQLGLLNFPLILWEKTLASFVIDWAVPIGDWLSALDAALGYRFLSGSYTHRNEAIRAVEEWSAYTPPVTGVADVSADFYGHERALMIRRGVYSSSPLPRPFMKNPMSLGHMANGLSLLAAVFTPLQFRTRR